VLFIIIGCRANDVPAVFSGWKFYQAQSMWQSTVDYILGKKSQASHHEQKYRYNHSKVLLTRLVTNKKRFIYM